MVELYVVNEKKASERNAVTINKKVFYAIDTYDVLIR